MDELIGQFVIAAIFVTAETYVGTHITKDVCSYLNDPLSRDFFMAGDVALFVLMVGLFGFVVWLKEQAKLAFGLVFLSSLLSVVLICLNVWGMPNPM
jgi:hypothetical protein